ncbi:MAG: nitroreductase family protein [Paludibacteraceae bacterium]|nr:nitroreductase family protein [Paludibacteraceae bacterium]
MYFFELIKKRYSVRGFKNTAVEPEKLELVMEAARLAPSAVNFQPWKFFVITDKKILNELSKTYSREWFKTAPTCIVACGDHQTSWKRSDGKDHCDIDVAIAVEHIMLAATELGLGTCWVCNFDAKMCAEILNLPKELEPVAMIPIGYSDTDVVEKKRKPIDEIVEYI